METHSEASRGGPRQLMHMPNEVLARICYFLIPDEFDPRPLRPDEIRKTTSYQQIRGLRKFYSVRGTDPSTQRIVGLHESFRLHTLQRSLMRSEELTYDDSDSRSSEIPECPVLVKTTYGGDGPTTGIANLAATCHNFNDQAQLLRSQRNFTLTLSNHGITFEGLRDATPLQTLKAHVKGNIPLWIWVDPTKQEVVRVGDGDVPGNRAFRAFANVFGRVKHLCIHIEMDLDPESCRKTNFFLDQISKFLEARQGDPTCLSTLEVAANVGFHTLHLWEHSIYSSSHTMPRGLALDLALMSWRSPSKSYNAAQVCGASVGRDIGCFVHALQRFRTAQNDLRRRKDLTEMASQSPIAVRILIRGIETPSMRWGQWASGGNGSLSGPSFGSFEQFCSSLVSRLRSTESDGEPMISIIMKGELMCELDIPDIAAQRPQEKINTSGGRDNSK
ncbi:hypothetical protein H2200_005511 [Cladophialophora chaetospira]|uniref:Uncharacterized protein n=1 Tax=Cladophialophora chaetospira TaxID=386627 RepID=A0AA38XC79_9EURO|nr:hypothetical protein H2200_005511 [Cladophialophora chaetospira]